MTASRPSYVKSTAWILAANALVLLFSFLLRPLAARFIGPEEYGLFALILSTAAIVPAFTSFSMNNAVLYFVSKFHANKKAVSAYIGSALVLVTALFALFFLPLYLFIPQLVSEIRFWPFLVAYGLAYASVALYVLQSAQQGLEQFKAYSLTTFLSTLLAGILTVAAAIFFKDAVWVGALRAIGIGLVVVAGFIVLKKSVTFDRARLKSMAAYAAPLAAGGLFAAVYPVMDRYLIANFHPAAEVAYYDVSYSIVAAILPFTTTFFTVMSPTIIKQADRFAAHFKPVSTAVTLTVCAFALGAYYFSDIIVSILLGSPYAQAGALMKILALGLPFMAFFGLILTSLNSLGKTKLSSLFVFLLTAGIVLSNLWLTPTLGGLGAAWANLVAYAFIAIMGLAYLRTACHIEIRVIAWPLVCFYAFVAFYAVLEPFGFFAKAVGYAAFGILMLYAHRDLVQKAWADFQSGRLRKATPRIPV